MKARLALIVAACVCLLAAGVPARAQQAQNSTAPAQNELVGPPQLSNFTLNGTVTRQANSPERQSPPPQARQPASSAPPTSSRSVTATNGKTASPGVATPQREAAALPPPTVDLPPPQAAPIEQAPADLGEPSEVTAQTPAPAPASPSQFPSNVPILPWLIAAVALAAAVGLFFFRQRSRQGYAAAGTSELFDISPEVAAPAPKAAETPAAIPAEPKAAPSGIVSTRLRPWIEISVEPGRAIVDEKKAAVEFHVTVFNSGSVAARNVLIEASLFNAGPHQDMQIQAFFDRPLGEGEPIPSLPAMQRISVRSAVVLPRDQVQALEFEGRALFVPMLAFNALYAWPGGKGQTSASYLVGKQTEGDKLAPLRLDLGPRLFRNLAAREHELKLRT